VIENTFADELVPVGDAIEEAGKFDAAGLRYQLILHAGADHLIWATQDRFADDVAALGNPARVRRPGAFDYSWDPRDDDRAKGIGVTGVYWLDDLAARDGKKNAAVAARDQALPDPAVTIVRNGPTTITSPVPGVQHGLRWEMGARPAAVAAATLTLTNVSALALDATGANLRTATLTVKTDGATTLRIKRLAGRTVVSEGGRRVARATPGGRATIGLSSGVHTLRISARVT